MLEQVLRHLNNWFLVEIHEGTFTVENGSITLPFLLTNQYFRICGSVFNDGLHQYPAVDLTDVYRLCVGACRAESRNRSFG